MISKSEFKKVQELLSNKVKIDNKKKSYFHPYTTTFKCGECGNFLTAEHRTKTNKKDGFVHHYDYYHCTNQRITKCSQGSVELRSLEEQILVKAESLHLPNGLKEVCLSFINDEFSKDNSISKNVVDTKQKQINKLEQKKENLLEMRLDGDIDSDSYSLKKESINDDIKLIKESITEIEQELVKNTRKEINNAFHFNEKYKEALSKSSDEDKRFLVRSIGMNYIAIDKKIMIELKPEYKEVRLLVNSIKSEYGIIEPKKSLILQSSFEDLDRISPLMGQIIDRVWKKF